MLTLLSGSSIYRVSVTIEINGVPITVDFHLRTSGGVDWSPYLTPAHNAMLGHYFSTLDKVVYEKFLLLVLEVSFQRYSRCFSCLYFSVITLVLSIPRLQLLLICVKPRFSMCHI